MLEGWWMAGSPIPYLRSRLLVAEWLDSYSFDFHVD